uniref:Alpha-1,6-mannosyl-glycoprotein 2-beta-N-acetylglucosaminyltransferase n=1 Tax=Arion vulgaris TaxID=1028688 RepID=A0A0B7A2W5_9EUPU
MRLTLQRVLRVLLASSMLMFVVLNMRVFYQTPDSSISSHSLIALESSSKPAIGQSPSAQKINLVNNSPQVSDETTYQTYLANNSETLKQEVVRINTEQLINNLDKYPLNLSSDSLVIVIQTHDRPEYLHILIESLRNVLDIQNTLLIISHDVYSDKLNKIVEAVDFCPVMQIFYSFSQQIYSNEFPGEHPNDCPRDIKKEDAVKKKCNNAETPDKYGHYREAKYCQAKHHWIWKINQNF